MKKLLAFVLAALLLSALLTSCGNANDPDVTTAPEAVVSDPGATTTAPETSNPAFNPSEDLTALDYTGKTIKIATTDEKVWEFKAEEQTGNVVNDAIYSRNSLVNQDLGVELEIIEFKQSGGNSKELKNAVIAANQSGDSDSIDFISAPSYYTSAYVTDGLIIDLESIENSHLDMTKSYWSGKYYENGKFLGRSYFILGDLTPTVIERLEVVFLNDELAKTYLKEETKTLYQTVYDREWTFDKFKTLVASCGEGLTSGIFGCELPVNSYSIDGMEAGMGVKMITKTEDSVISEIKDEHNVELVEALREFYYKNTSVNRVSNEEYPNFRNNQALFAVGLLLESSKFINSNIDYSIYPIPMWNADQADYISTSQDVYSMISIPACAEKRAEMITAVLEDLAWRSHDTVYTAMYDITYSSRYSDNYDESAMFDFIYQHIDFSFGAIFSYVFGEIKNCPRYMLYPETASTAWKVNSPIASSFSVLDKQISTYLKKFMTAIGGN